MNDIKEVRSMRSNREKLKIISLLKNYFTENKLGKEGERHGAHF